MISEPQLIEIQKMWILDVQLRFSESFFDKLKYE
jgi:hypothetical protein